MKIQTPTHSKKALIIVGILALLIIVGIFTYPLYGNTVAQFFGGQPQAEEGVDNPTDIETPPVDQPATDEQIKDGEDIKKDIIDRDQNQEEPSSEVKVVITRAAKNDAGLTVQVRSLVSTLTPGTCTLRATANGKVYAATANTQPLASSSTCKGFDIPVSKLGSGTWDISISYSNSTQEGAASIKVEI